MSNKRRKKVHKILSSFMRNEKRFHNCNQFLCWFYNFSSFIQKHKCFIDIFICGLLLMPDQWFLVWKTERFHFSFFGFLSILLLSPENWIVLLSLLVVCVYVCVGFDTKSYHQKKVRLPFNRFEQWNDFKSLITEKIALNEIP